MRNSSKEKNDMVINFGKLKKPLVERLFFYALYLKLCPSSMFRRVWYISLMMFFTSSLCTVSHVVCMYFRGRDINTEGTPPLEYANASVSVPVELELAASCTGIFFLAAVSRTSFLSLLCTAGALVITPPCPATCSPSLLAL